MKYLHRFCLVTLALLATAAPAADNGADDARIDAIFAHWDQPGTPGCAVAISRGGESLYARGYGYANLDDDVPITPRTVFDVASVTKQFVAASLSMLAVEGKLSFEDDVRQYLPELPVYEQPVTLQHMVYHTSGLRDYLNLFPLAGRDDYYPVSHQQILDLMARQRALNFMPGEQYEYSNTAFMLLAQVVERVSGQTLGEFVRQRIFEPLGMQDSLMYNNLEHIIKQRAIGYVRNGEDVRIKHNFNFDVPGDGQMYTTVHDLLRWNNYLYGARNPEFFDILMQAGALNDGSNLGLAKGLYVGEYRGAPTVYHTGSSWGFRSILIRFMDAGLAIAIACNDDNAGPHDLALRIADHLLADELGQPESSAENADESLGEETVSVPLSLTRAQRAKLLGTFYSAELDAIYRISSMDGGLFLRIEQELPVQVLAVSARELEFEFQPPGWSSPATVRLDFQHREDGDVTGFLLSAGTERGIVFDKVYLPSSGDRN